VTVVSFQVERCHQLSLVEHDYVWSLLADEPVQVLLLLRGVDASHIPHEDGQRDLLDVEVPSLLLLHPGVSSTPLIGLGSRLPVLAWGCH
jgi:hypothetical protein